MKIPTTPPDVDVLITKMIEKNSTELKNVFTQNTRPDPNGNYYHWDKLKYLKVPPEYKNQEHWWIGIKFARRALYNQISHNDKGGEPFVYGEPAVVRRLLHQIDLIGGGPLSENEQIANPNTRDSYLVNSLIEESITSSQLEGAATTRKVAKEMLRLKRKPRNRSETMIINNYYAMEFIRENSTDELTPEMIQELHQIITKDTLDNPDAVGKLRITDDIYVGDTRDSSILHNPPEAIELEKRLNSICEFANIRAGDSEIFLHPVVRAIILHFLLAYDHPFEDGNGRTARALFYWSMLKQGYWTMEFISISRILKGAPASYMRSYLHTETDENDLTYFIIYQLEVILRAINDLLKYLESKAKEIRSIEEMVRNSAVLNVLFNHRQIVLINRAFRKPLSIFYIESHRNAHNITYQTARTDLLKLVELGILEKRKIGSAFSFTAVSDLKEKLEAYS